MYEVNFVLSAMAPDTMVAAVAANTAWKSQKANIQRPSGLPGFASDMKKFEDPMNPAIELPNMRPNPIMKKAMEPTEKSIRFFMIIFPALFALVKPISTMANPACMKNTRNAATSIQTTLIALILETGSGTVSSAKATTANPKTKSINKP